MFKRTVRRRSARRRTVNESLGEWTQEHRGALAVAVGALLAVVVFVCIRWWGWLSDSQSNSATIRDLGLLVVVPVTLGLAFWRNTIARRQAETARGGLLNERFQKGAEMLAGKTTLVRIGGVHALHQIAQENPEAYARQVARLLAAFVRHPDSEDERRSATEAAGDDVVAAVEAICMCRARNPGMHLALEFKGANLRQAAFFAISLDGADFSEADLSEAQFDEVDLSGATLEGATLIGAQLTGPEPIRPCVMVQANLRDANLTRADLIDTELEDADLSGAALVDADLISANLRDASLREADLTGATLVGADLRGAILTGAILKGADLSGALLHSPPAEPAGISPVRGLKQAQLDEAIACPDRPPILGSVEDASSGMPLTWNN